MTDIKGHLKKCICGVFYIGMSVQILLGIIWMFGNLFSYQNFGTAAGNIQIGFPGCTLLYVLQLLAAAYAAYRFLRCLGVIPGKGERYSGPDRLKAVWCILCVLTVPVLLQCHLSTLPCSLIMSAELILLSAVTEGLRERPGRGKCILRICICLAVGVICAGGINLVYTGSTGNGKSPVHMALSRIVWPYFQQNYAEWPEEVKLMMDWEEAGNISMYPDEVENTFIPLMEETFGEDKAAEMYLRMIKPAFRNNTRQIAYRILWDSVCYSISPPMLLLQLEGVGYESYSGRNYDIMRQNMPGFTSVYVRYGCWWFGWGLILGIAGLILHGERRRMGALWLLPVALSFLNVVFCTLSGAGVMDYKNTVLVTALWMLWMLWSLVPGREIHGEEKDYE